MASLLHLWRNRLPKEKTKEELDEYYDKVEDMNLKSDFPAMLLGLLMALWPLLIIIAAIVIIPMWLFGALW